MILLILLTPLGLLASGTAFGEWGPDELKQTLGYVPAGVEAGESSWSALFPDYSVPGLGDDFLHSSAGYIFSAVVGSALIYVSVVVISKFLVTKDTKT